MKVSPGGSSRGAKGAKGGDGGQRGGEGGQRVFALGSRVPTTYGHKKFG